MPNANSGRRTAAFHSSGSTPQLWSARLAALLQHVSGFAAVVATLLLLLAERVASECLAKGAGLLERSPLWPLVMRKPFAVSLACCLVGTATSVVIGFGALPTPIGAALIILACTGLAVAAPLALAAVAAPDRLEEFQISAHLRRIHARSGRNELDSGWSEVVVAAGLLIVPPFLIAMAFREASLPALLIHAAAVWGTRRSLVDFEHGDSHYDFFKPHSSAAPGDRRCLTALRWFAHQPLALMSGRIPHWYAVQHVAVHHAENNGLADTQSTAPYDRASFGGFAACAQRFALSGLIPLDVLLYLTERRRTKAIRRLCTGYGVYLAWLAALFAINPAIALVLVGLRYVSLVADAASFFQEHGLIDPVRPQTVITGALHYISSDRAHGNRGEDAHIEHHLRPGLHWSRYITRYAARLREYEQQKAIGFYDAPGQLKVYFRLLWRRDFIELARHVHVFGGDGMSTDEIACLIEARTAPAGPNPRRPLPHWVECHAGRLAASIL